MHTLSLSLSLSLYLSQISQHHLPSTTAIATAISIPFRPHLTDSTNDRLSPTKSGYDELTSSGDRSMVSLCIS